MVDSAKGNVQLKGQCYDSGLISTDDNLLGKEYCVHV